VIHPYKQPDLLNLDRESVQVWPCFRESTLGEWVLRFGGGVYGRSNSVQPYGDPGCDLSSAIDQIEAAYRAEGIRPMFRLPDCLNLEALDSTLESRGYEIGEPTDVLVSDTAGFHVDPAVRLEEEYDEAWLSSYMKGSGRGAGRREAVSQLMRKVAPPKRFARIEWDGEIACNGLGVIHNGKLWLFGIATVPEFRRRGLAVRLVSTLIAWGREAGATSTALQVSSGNEAAITLYRGMGMGRAYSYHYRRL